MATFIVTTATVGLPLIILMKLCGKQDPTVGRWGILVENKKIA